MHLFDYVFRQLTPEEEIEIRAFRRDLPERHPEHTINPWAKNVAKAIEWGTHFDSLGYDVYFGVTPRRRRNGTQEGVTRAWAIWADLDTDYNKTAFLLPPSAVIASGTPGRAHLYWFLKDPIPPGNLLNRCLQRVQQDYEADTAAVDSARILRVPETHNFKTQPPTTVTTLELNDFLYTPDDILRAHLITPSVIPMIIKGEVPEGKTRSERDFAVKGELTELGLSEGAQSSIFTKHAVGDKIKEKNGDKYEKRTTSRIKEKKASIESDVGVGEEQLLAGIEGIFVGHHAYYSMSSNDKATNLSSFIFKVKALHKGADSRPDAYVCDILTLGDTIRDFVITSDKFNTSLALRKALPKVSCSWYGTDRQSNILRQLLYLQWQELGENEVIATSLVGRQYYKEHNLDVVVLPTKEAFDSTGTARPDIIFRNDVDQEHLLPIDYPNKPLDVEIISLALNYLAKIQPEEVTTPMLGWWAATPYKPILKENALSFPHLLVHGTRGSGKTTLITKVFQPLFGFTQPHTWLCTTTPHALIVVLGQTVSVPTCFTEYRSGIRNENSFLQTLRTAYDDGKISKGRADLSTTTFPLTAPICIDGEDMADDPAMQERLLSVRTSPETTRHAIYQSALFAYQQLDVSSFMRTYTLYCMRTDPIALYEEARDQLAEAIPWILPQRTLHNYAVVLMGLKSLHNFCLEYALDSPVNLDTVAIGRIFSKTLLSLIDPAKQRTILPVDMFVEDVINEVGRMKYYGNVSFPYVVQKFRVGFQLKQAYNWWAESLAKRRSDIPPYRTIQQQLLERQTEHTTEGKIAHEPGQYFIKADRTNVSNAGTMYMYYVSIPNIIASGLDIANFIDTQAEIKQLLTLKEQHK